MTYRYPAQRLIRAVRISDAYVPVAKFGAWNGKGIYVLPDGTRGECGLGPEDWYWQVAWEC